MKKQWWLPSFGCHSTYQFLEDSSSAPPLENKNSTVRFLDQTLQVSSGHLRKQWNLLNLIVDPAQGRLCRWDVTLGGGFGQGTLLWQPRTWSVFAASARFCADTSGLVAIWASSGISWILLLILSKADYADGISLHYYVVDFAGMTCQRNCHRNWRFPAEVQLHAKDHTCGWGRMCFFLNANFSFRSRSTYVHVRSLLR